MVENTQEDTTERTYTYAEIGKELGITPSAVRKIEQRALQKLREAFKRKGHTLSDYI